MLASTGTALNNTPAAPSQAALSVTKEPEQARHFKIYRDNEQYREPSYPEDITVMTPGGKSLLEIEIPDLCKALQDIIAQHRDREPDLCHTAEFFEGLRRYSRELQVRGSTSVSPALVKAAITNCLRWYSDESESLTSIHSLLHASEANVRSEAIKAYGSYLKSEDLANRTDSRYFDSVISTISDKTCEKIGNILKSCSPEEQLILLKLLNIRAEARSKDTKKTGEELLPAAAARQIQNLALNSSEAGVQNISIFLLAKAAVIDFSALAKVKVAEQKSDYISGLAMGELLRQSPQSQELRDQANSRIGIHEEYSERGYRDHIIDSFARGLLDTAHPTPVRVAADNIQKQIGACYGSSQGGMIYGLIERLFKSDYISVDTDNDQLGKYLCSKLNLTLLAGILGAIDFSKLEPSLRERASWRDKKRPN